MAGQLQRTGHVVEGGRQFRRLVPGGHQDARGEIAGADGAAPLRETAQRGGEGSGDADAEDQGEQDRRAAGQPHGDQGAASGGGQGGAAGPDRLRLVVSGVIHLQQERPFALLELLLGLQERLARDAAVHQCRDRPARIAQFPGPRLDRPRERQLARVVARHEQLVARAGPLHLLAPFADQAALLILLVSIRGDPAEPGLRAQQAELGDRRDHAQTAEAQITERLQAGHGLPRHGRGGPTRSAGRGETPIGHRGGRDGDGGVTEQDPGAQLHADSPGRHGEARAAGCDPDTTLSVLPGRN
jgi:hypothetical protein